MGYEAGSVQTRGLFLRPDTLQTRYNFQGLPVDLEWDGSEAEARPFLLQGKIDEL